jgi:hypothetical protein
MEFRTMNVGDVFEELESSLLLYGCMYLNEEEEEEEGRLGTIQSRCPTCLLHTYSKLVN